MHPARSSRPPRAFTLIELLTVIAIIGILAAIIIPVVGSVRNKARMATSMNNLRQLGSAMQIFVNDNKQTLPVNSANHTTHYWYRELWRIIYAGQPVPAIPTVPDTRDRYIEVFGNTVFFTPLMEDVPSPRAYGYNAYLSQFTTAGVATNPATPLQFGHVANPARTVALGDSTSINLFRSTATGRNDGLVFCVFVDGHVDKLRPPETANPNPSAEERRMPYNEASTFWRGVPRAANGTVLTVW